MPNSWVAACLMRRGEGALCPASCAAPLRSEITWDTHSNRMGCAQQFGVIVVGAGMVQISRMGHNAARNLLLLSAHQNRLPLWQGFASRQILIFHGWLT